MPSRYCSVLLLASLSLLPSRPRAAAASAPAQAAVYFSPHGGATAAVVAALDAAQHEILVQAYSFTSAPIAQALVQAHQRGVQVLVVLDKSNATAQYSAATFVAHASIPTLIDAAHAIAHNKVMIIDRRTVLTGSFNFSKAAEAHNAENLLLLTDSPQLVAAYTANLRQHAAHSRPYVGPGATAARPAAVAAEAATSPVRANPRSKVYRLAACTGFRGMTSPAVVGFADATAAQQAGYRRAKDCP